jgi:hypothetical protein
MSRLRILAVVPVLVAAGLCASVSPTHAQTNNQSGLVNVNLQDLSLAVPVSVALPIGLAADACGINVLAVQQANNACTATSNTPAVSSAVANAMTGTGGGGGANNNQSGLVNVNIQNLALAVPVSIALPIGVAANVCGVCVLSLQQGANTCNATTTSTAMSQALARALAGA